MIKYNVKKCFITYQIGRCKLGGEDVSKVGTTFGFWKKLEKKLEL
jgi:hypothetical protein